MVLARGRLLSTSTHLIVQSCYPQAQYHKFKQNTISHGVNSHGVASENKKGTSTILISQAHEAALFQNFEPYALNFCCPLGCVN